MARRRHFFDKKWVLPDIEKNGKLSAARKEKDNAYTSKNNYINGNRYPLPPKTFIRAETDMYLIFKTLT